MRELGEERHICRRCGGVYWHWQSVLEHKPDCLYRLESEASTRDRDHGGVAPELEADDERALDDAWPLDTYPPDPL